MSRFIDADAYIENYECCGYLDEISVEKFNEITPTVDVTPVVHGEWIVLYDENSPQDGIWKCSVCDYIRFVDDITPMNYCPNCGADMRGVT